VPLVAGLFYGIKPAVTAIVLHAAHRIGSRALKNSVAVGIAGSGLRRHLRLDMPFPLIVLAAALIGYSAAALAPDKFSRWRPRRGGSLRPGADRRRHANAGARSFNWRTWRLSRDRRRAVGCCRWRADARLRLAGTLTQMGWFFTKAALLTFGGAYAVLPYVYQGAVDTSAG
jgi:chromate transporter